MSRVAMVLFKKPVRKFTGNPQQPVIEELHEFSKAFELTSPLSAIADFALRDGAHVVTMIFENSEILP